EGAVRQFVCAAPSHSSSDPYGSRGRSVRAWRIAVTAPDGASSRDDAPGPVKGPGVFVCVGSNMINVGIYGVTGYAGYELLRWIGRHPEARVVFTPSESQAGKALADVYPGPLDTPLLAPDDAPLGEVDVVFLGLPHGVSAGVAERALAAGVRVIDLSADFRLRKPADYARWYGHAHPAPALLPAPY